MVNEKRIHPPPPPSLPKEAPWRELEAITNNLNAIADKLDVLISQVGVAPVAPGVTPTIIIPTTPELAPLTSRLDKLIAGLVTNKPSWIHGQADVPTVGEPVQLDDIPIPDGFKLTVLARTGNTGYIYAGKSKGDCANTKRRLDGLGAGLAASFRVQNANAVWVDSSVADEGVSWFVEAG